AEWRSAGGEVWQGDVYLYGICVLSAVTGGRAGGGKVVCESGRRALVVGRSLFVVRYSRANPLPLCTSVFSVVREEELNHGGHRDTQRTFVRSRPPRGRRSE